MAFIKFFSGYVLFCGQREPESTRYFEAREASNQGLLAPVTLKQLTRIQNPSRCAKRIFCVALDSQRPLSRRRQLPGQGPEHNVCVICRANAPAGASAGNTPLTATTPSVNKQNSQPAGLALFAIFKIIFPLILSEQSGDNLNRQAVSPAKFPPLPAGWTLRPSLPGR